MKARVIAVLAASLLAMTGCENNNRATGLTPQEVGPFGLPVGQPINVISATRGDGVSFDKFAVTFNNAEGTDITITTPEGEEIELTEADLEWAGTDSSLGMQIAKFTSSRGDRVDVVIGSARVPVPPVEDGVGPLAAIDGLSTEDVDVVALGRLDEVDTRLGFETYGVIGQETDPADLPRYAVDVFVGDTVDVTPAGSLAAGTAHYDGEFLASVFAFGELRSDSAIGCARVDIDFANGDVDVWMNGSYRYDDTDDIAPGAVVDIHVNKTTINGIDYVTSIEPVYGDPGLTGQVVTGLNVVDQLVSDWPCVGVCVPTSVVDSVTPVYGTVANDGDIVTALNVSTLSTSSTLVVTGVSVVRSHENDDNYAVHLSGSGGPTDVTFDNGVRYSGTLEGSVEVSVDKYGNTWTPSVSGEFAGAVYGPGAGATTVDSENFGEVVDATTTAGVFEAGGGGLEGEDPVVQTVGGYIAESDGFSAAPFEPVPPEPPAEPAAN